MYWTPHATTFIPSINQRDFFRSRIVRVSRRLNPDSDCTSDEECLLEMKDADPVGLTMALKEEVGDNWWLKRRLVNKVFGRGSEKSGS